MVKKTKVKGKPAFSLTFGNKSMVVKEDDKLYVYIEEALEIPDEKRHCEGSNWTGKRSWYARCWNEWGRNTDLSDFTFVLKALSTGEPKSVSPVPLELVANASKESSEAAEMTMGLEG